MISTQVERLQKDFSVLDNFIKELTERGEEDKIRVLKTKKRYLEDRLSEVTSAA